MPSSSAAAGSSRLTHDDALLYLKKVKEQFSTNKDVYERFLCIMKDFKGGKIDTYGVINRVKKLFKGHRELILGFNTFLPKGYEITDDGIKTPPNARQPVEFNQAITYVNKIKHRFERDERVYKAFLEILNMYRRGLKNISHVYEEVAQLFANHDDLLKEFTYFLPDSRAPPAASGRKSKAGASKRSKVDKKAREAARAEQKKIQANLSLVKGQFFDKVKAKLRNKDTYNDFLRCLNLYIEDIISKQELVTLVEDVLYRHPDLMAQIKELVNQAESGIADFDLAPDKVAARLAKLREEEISKYYAPINELDLSACDRCTPSYRKLPSDYPKYECTGRKRCTDKAFKRILETVLNDNWVSVTSGSEDYGFKNVRWNQYEENLSRCEDDKYELEMILACHKSTMAHLKARTEVEGKEVTLGNLSAVQKRSISKLYPSMQKEILHLLKKHPAVSIPIVLKRMEEKEKEWLDIQGHMDSLWSKVYAQNYHKSLDHRSFYFKQMDKKRLSAKSMISEIKDLSSKRKLEHEDAELALLSGYPPKMVSDKADLTLEYASFDCHRDACSVLQAAIHASVGGGTADKLCSFLRSFILPFIGLTEKECWELIPEAEEEESEEEDEDEEKEDMDVDKKKDAGKGKGGGRWGKKHKVTKMPDRPLADEPVMGYGWLPEEKKNKKAKTQRYTDAQPIVSSFAGGSKPAEHPLMFVSEPVYVLFQLHKTLFDRLATARQCCKQPDGWRPDGKAGPAAGAGADGAMHDEFLEALTNLVDGSIEIGEFEDECRRLLGAKSYILCTIDKLVSKIVKQLQYLMQDEVSTKLLALHRYEKARAGTSSELQYWVNVATLLHDETCFRIQATGGYQIEILLLDGFNERLHIPAGSLDKNFAEYMKRYVQTDTPAVTQSRNGIEEVLAVYRRKLEKKGRKEDLAGCILRNGLEHKVSCSTSKVSYVLDTEDIFFRPKSSRSA